MLICDSCGTENPSGARFCAGCQSYLGWSDRDEGTPHAPAAVKPSSHRPGPSNRPPDLDLNGSATSHKDGISLTAAPTQPAQVVEPSAQKKPVEPALPPMARRPPRYEFVRETRAPIAVKTVTEPPAEPPAGQAANSGRHGLWLGLDEHSVAVEPGRQVSVRAQVANKGTVVEGVDIRVLGLPDEWVRIEPRRINLDVGGRASFAVHFAPPKATTTRSGLVDIEVAVWSVSSPRVRCAEHVRLEVGSYHDLEIGPMPPELTVRRSGRFTLALHNNGNNPMGVEARPKPGAAADGAVILTFEPRRLSLAPNGQATVAVEARAARRLITGRPVTHAVPIEVLGADQPRPVELKMIQRPLLPGWAPRILTLVCVLLTVGAGLGAWNWYKHRPEAVPSVLNQPADLAIANLNKAGFKGVPLQGANAKVPAGRVFREDPPPGTHHRPGTVIAVTVSSGPPAAAGTNSKKDHQ
jgi:PASTA domain